MRLRGRERVSTEVRTWLPPGLPPASPTFAMELVEPSSINFSGTSASIVGDGSVTFTAVTSLSLNGVFSSAYDNYMVVMTGLPSTQLDPLCRLRVGGVDSNTGYTFQFLAAGGTTITAGRSTSQTSWISMTFDSASPNGYAEMIYGPALAQPTAMRAISARSNGGATISDIVNTHSTATAYDGFTFTTSAGNHTGRIAVYGLRG